MILADGLLRTPGERPHSDSGIRQGDGRHGYCFQEHEDEDGCTVSSHREGQAEVCPCSTPRVVLIAHEPRKYLPIFQGPVLRLSTCAMGH